jgi:predicted chitinase
VTEPAPAKKDPLAHLTRFAAVAGSLIAAGQAATTWIGGYYKAEAEREQTERAKVIAEVQQRSSLAESYLKLVLAKETPPADRVVLFSALAQIEGHPLRAWAQQQHDGYQRYIEALSTAYAQQRDAARRQEDAGDRIKLVEADIQALVVQVREAMNEPARAEKLQAQVIEKSKELGKLKAVYSLAEDRSRAAQVFLNAGAKPGVLPPAPVHGPASTLQAATSKVDAALLRPLFPAGSERNIDVAVPFLQAALQEFKVTDIRVIAAIIATVRVETPRFEAYEEPVEQARRWAGRLGNADATDAVKYRGRGYIGLTGRENYQRVSVQLGLGTRLLDFPDDAKSPEVATRILVGWFVQRREAVATALDNGDLGRLRRIVNGGLQGLEQFTRTYEAALAGLNANPTTQGATPQPAQPAPPAQPR